MLPINQVLNQTIGKNNGINNLSEPEPEPLNCIFCHGDIRFEALMHPFRANKVFAWLSPGRCTCPGAVENWQKYDDEQERLYQEELLLEQERERQQIIERLFVNSQIPDRFKARTFQNFNKTPENNNAYRTAFEYAENFHDICKTGKGLMFFGTVGTGKTHLAAAITLTLIGNCESVVFGTVTSLLGRIRATYNDGSRETEGEVMRKLQDCKLLVIDDLGKEKPTEWVEQTLYEIINHRYEYNKPLIITTNTSLKGIESQYQKNGEAIVSRIAEMCKGIHMAWNDYRKVGT